MKLEDVRTARKRAAALLREAGIAVMAREVETMEISDFGLGRPELYGFEIVGYRTTTATAPKRSFFSPPDLPGTPAPSLGAGPSGKAGDLPLPLGRGLSLHRGGAGDGAESRPSGGGKTEFHRLA